jgi:diguanylate cyclase (GGDEF)-like protein/PAS domain S-box-containing protein
MSAKHGVGSTETSLAKVLLVEDSAGDASLVMSALDNPTVWVQSLRAALDALVETPYDCLLVDLGLPDADGLDVIVSLREAAGDSAIVVLTGRVDEEFALRAIQRGADDYCLKSDLSARGLHRSINYAVERTRARVALEQLSVRTAAVMAALGDGLLVVDTIGRIISANPAAEKILGAPEADMVGLSLLAGTWTYLHEDGTPVVDGELLSQVTVASGGPPSGVVRGFRRSDGGLSWVELNTRLLPSTDGKVEAVVVSVRDITERLVAEEAARFQAALLARVGQAVIATDPLGQILYCNRAAEDLYGWSAAELMNHPIGEFAPSEFNEQVSQIMQAVESGSSWTGEFLVRRRNGTSIPVLVTNSPMFDESGNLRAIIGVFTDISERKQAEETAGALSAIVESTADAILTMSLNGTVLTWNRGAQDLYGYSAEDAIGMNVQILNPDGPNSMLSSLTLMEAGETVRGFEAVRRRSDGHLVDVSLTGSPIYGEDGQVVGASSIGRDISDRKRLQEELARQAMHDALTGLPNRTLLSDRLAQALAGAARRNVAVAVLFLDLDRFKTINDANGHLIGDDLLVKVAERLGTVTRPADTVARFGGDEFVIVCDDTDTIQALEVAQRLEATFRDPIEVGGKWQYISASIGIAVSPPLEADPDALLRYADTAMYDAKARGRARIRVFDASLGTESSDRLDLTNDLREALKEDALEVHYQPVVELATGRLVGLEALARWHHPHRGWIPPSLFVLLAEENGLVATFDRWVLDRACADGAMFVASGVLPLGALLSVNVSAHNIVDLDLVSTVRQSANRAGFPLNALELEVTETAVMTEVPTIRGVLDGIRQLGVGIALDDFGTGYSSLTYIRQLPVTTIKIDRSFTQHVTARDEDRAIAASVIDLARAVGLRTIAEGVETAEQLAVLYELGCEAGQGYLWSMALPAHDLTALMSDDTHSFLSAGKRSRSRSPGRRVHSPSSYRQRWSNAKRA